jgi:hypothetical protein
MCSGLDSMSRIVDSFFPFRASCLWSVSFLKRVFVTFLVVNFLLLWLERQLFGAFLVKEWGLGTGFEGGSSTG